MKMNNKYIFVILGVVIVVLGSAFILWPRLYKGYSGKMESITFGVVPSEGHALLYIAQDQHFFTNNGLRVVVKSDFFSGVDALNGLLSNEIDIADSAEYAVVKRAFEKSKVSIVATVDKEFGFTLNARKDRGIENIADLKGKRIGLICKAVQSFHLERFLSLHGVNVGDVNLVDMEPPQTVDALRDGFVDAVVSYGSVTYEIQRKLAGNLVRWSIQSGQPSFGVYVCRNEWIAQHPELVDRFLKSLAQAEDYLIRNPASYKNVLRKLFSYEDEFLETTWSENQFYLSLDQSLVAAMEGEARWMIKNGITIEKTVPDFTRYIYIDGLNAIKPEAVNIFR